MHERRSVNEKVLGIWSFCIQVAWQASKTALTEAMKGSTQNFKGKHLSNRACWWLRSIGLQLRLPLLGPASDVNLHSASAEL